MDYVHPPARRDLGGILVAVMGLIPAMAFAIYVAEEAQPGSDGPGARRTDGGDHAKIDAARKRAIQWATPECRNRVAAAVARARTERAVEDMAWRACPNHPDALE